MSAAPPAMAAATVLPAMRHPDHAEAERRIRARSAALLGRLSGHQGKILAHVQAAGKLSTAARNANELAARHNAEVERVRGLFANTAIRRARLRTVSQIVRKWNVLARQKRVLAAAAARVASRRSTNAAAAAFRRWIACTHGPQTVHADEMQELEGVRSEHGAAVRELEVARAELREAAEAAEARCQTIAEAAAKQSALEQENKAAQEQLRLLAADRDDTVATSSAAQSELQDAECARAAAEAELEQASKSHAAVVAGLHQTHASLQREHEQTAAKLRAMTQLHAEGEERERVSIEHAESQLQELEGVRSEHGAAVRELEVARAELREAAEACYQTIAEAAAKQSALEQENKAAQEQLCLLAADRDDGVASTSSVPVDDKQLHDLRSQLLHLQSKLEAEQHANRSLREQLKQTQDSRKDIAEVQTTASVSPDTIVVQPMVGTDTVLIDQSSNDAQATSDGSVTICFTEPGPLGLVWSTSDDGSAFISKIKAGSPAATCGENLREGLVLRS
eukprot:SAG31_NODE_5567_length_2453_cov_3.441801_1_plen_509_part_01